MKDITLIIISIFLFVVAWLQYLTTKNIIINHQYYTKWIEAISWYVSDTNNKLTEIYSIINKYDFISIEEITDEMN